MMKEMKGKSVIFQNFDFHIDGIDIQADKWSHMNCAKL